MRDEPGISGQFSCVTTGTAWQTRRIRTRTQHPSAQTRTKKIEEIRNDSGSPDVLIRGLTAVTVESSLGQGIYACPANENVGCSHAKEALGRWSVLHAAGRQVPRCQCPRG